MPDTNTIYNILIGIAVGGGLIYYFYSTRNAKKEPETLNTTSSTTASGSNTLQLQAYERLTLLTDRIALSNLISRTNHTGMSATEMQFVLTKTIREEFDFNITQQIYVTPEIWKALKNLRETNLLIINQVAGGLPANATALDLNRALLQFAMSDERANLHVYVSEALSHEAKKFL